MSPRISVEQLLSVFADTYRSIDIRTAAMLEGESWISGLTVVRLSYQDPEAIAQKHKELEAEHGSVKTEHFQIILRALPFSDWETLAADCAEGLLRVGDGEIRLREKKPLQTQLSDIRRHQYELRQADKWSWPSFDVWFGQHRPEKLGHDNLAREVGAHGWANAYQAINSLCEINVWQSGPYSYDFFLSIPVFVLISGLQISSGDNQLQASFARHQLFKHLNAVAFVKELNANRAEIIKSRLQLPFRGRESNGVSITEDSSSVKLPELDSEDLIELKVFHPKIGEIDSIQRTVRDLIPKERRNILFAALRYLCPDAELEELLVRPYEHKPKKLRESAAFELHVAWILGLFGFSTIVLGEYEKILARTTPAERASVDILATLGTSLMVVACTLKTPRDEDFSNLLHAREILAREVFSETGVYVTQVLFTGAIGYEPYREIKGGFGAIPIIDADRLGILLELLKSGREKRFLEFLASPQLSELRDPFEEVY